MLNELIQPQRPGRPARGKQFFCFSVNLLPSMIEQLEEIANRESMSKSSVVRIAVRDFLAQKKKGGKEKQP